MKTLLTVTALAAWTLHASADVSTNNIKPYLLTPKTTYDGQPTLCHAADGTLWSGWVAYANPAGDAVMAAHQENGMWSAPEQINTTRAQIFRPTFAATGDTLWAFWTESGDDLARVVYSMRKDGKWSTPAPVSDTKAASQNQEIAVDRQGKLWVTWQEFHDGQYDIMLRTFDGKWSEPTAVTRDKYDDWDPTIACDSKGGVWVAWSGYRDGDYDIYIRRVDQPDAKEQRLSARGEYDLHPCIVADNEGRIWAVWDALTIPNHGSSGASTITGANLKGRKKINDPENPNQKALVAEIRLVCLQDGKMLTLPKSSKSLQPPEGHRLVHTALPKITVDANGRVWVAYRALTQPAITPADGTNAANAKPQGKKKKQQSQNQQQAKKGKKKKDNPNRWGPYWWDVYAQCYEGGTWSSPVMLPESDGTLEEVSMLGGKPGIEIAYEMEHRRKFSPNYAGFAKTVGEESEDHHQDFGKVLGYNGDVYIANLTADGTSAAAKNLVDRKQPNDLEVKPRVPREEAHRNIEVNDQKYTLLWGDLHKHSNLSRCSAGNEPSPEDHYKYAHDVCQYDFLAMSDHAEHTSDFNWWRIQKLADLYNVPGSFSVLYGYEWSARWPIGHHNVIWPERPVPILRSSVEATKTTTELWSTLAKFGKPALTIPHTMADPGMGTRWDNHDERFERIAEIFQACRGSYEYDGCPRQHVNATATNCFYQDGLAKGYHLGTICSSDHGWGTAYAVVYAKENSRKAAWQALYDRRCYGSTTYGLVVDFRMGNHIMGEEFSLDKPAEITVYAHGAAPIRQIDIFSERKLVHSQGSVQEPIGKKEVTLNWTPPSLGSGTNYYYARIIQDDDEMAWTSPVWVTSTEKVAEKNGTKQ